jgi:triacylglycerol lipase
MSALGLVKPGPPDPEPSTQVPAELRLQLQDTLAAGQRLWVRGRLVGSLPCSGGDRESKRWWTRRHTEDGTPPPRLQLVTRISGKDLEQEISVNSDGNFEAVFSAELPMARRTWRVARNRVVYGNHALEGSNLVLLPPEDAAAVLIVVLPLATTLPTAESLRLADTPVTLQLTQLLGKLKNTASDGIRIYYLAGVASESPNRQPELALAAASLGWPTGHFILVPTDCRTASAVLAVVLDRLRWLFAGTLDLWVLNLEPQATAEVAAMREPKEDRAVVRLLDDKRTGAGKVADDRRAQKGRGRRLSTRPTRAARLPRYPVVFCHGMLAFSMLKMHMPEDRNYFSHLSELLRQRGLRVLFPEVPATSGVKERAACLKELILRWTDEPVNLVCHSMGGLDARYLITHLDMADRVLSLTTVSTPHRGTYLADWFSGNFRDRVPLLRALEAFGVNVDGFRDCRLELCREFNACTPDMPGVRYFSFGGEVAPARLSPVLRRAWNILTPVEGPNDGMVSVASARWGEYLGTVNADHFAQTPDGVFVRTGENFDSVAFYSRLVEDLARRGF